ncbi:hypothetical protein CEK27_009966 [Fusarium fujikuroi]|nr:hypothetical protein CEK27_009966 [Fusarium fujikuroi]QGI83234.1 hypothetical protein CEK25_009963 [Fusarium fujikuroi]
MHCNRVSFLSYQFTRIGIISSTAWREQFSSFPGCEFSGRRHPFPCALFSVPPSPHLRPCTSPSPTTLNSNLRATHGRDEERAKDDVNRYRPSRDGRKRCQIPTGTITKDSKGGHRDPSTNRACLDLDWLDSSRIPRRHQHAIRRRQKRHSAYPWRLAGLWASDTDWNYGPGVLVRLRVLARLVAF